MIIPARDEEGSLPLLLRSLAQSTITPHEVVVVDDASTDRTADVASARGARVIGSGGPPPGWTGKTWACHRGVESTNGGLVLFLDADVRLDPNALAALLDARHAVGGLVSVQPHHTVGAPVEHLSALCNAVAVLGAGACSPVASWRRDAAVAYGPCMLTSRADYERAGGHEAVRASIAEDLALASRYRSAGLPTTAFTGGRLVTFRMYPDGLVPLLEGWTKNMATGAAVSSRPAVILTTTWIASLATVATAGALGARGRWPAYGLAAAGVRWATRRVGTFSIADAVAFPVPLATFVAVFARSALRLVRRAPVRWRGRNVPLGAGSV